MISSLYSIQTSTSIQAAYCKAGVDVQGETSLYFSVNYLEKPVTHIFHPSQLLPRKYLPSRSGASVIGDNKDNALSKVEDLCWVIDPDGKLPSALELLRKPNHRRLLSLHHTKKVALQNTERYCFLSIRKPQVNHCSSPTRGILAS